MTSRFSAVVEEILRSRKRARVFWEELPSGAPSAFDRNADAEATAEARRARQLSGFCNTENVETSFVMRPDDSAEELVASATGTTSRHRILICGLSTAVFGHPHAALTGIGAHISKNWLKVCVAGKDPALAGWLKDCVDPRLLVLSHESSLDSEQFDIVLGSDAASVKEVMRLLKPGGLYCFTGPLVETSGHEIKSYRFWSRSLGILGDKAFAHVVRKRL